MTILLGLSAAACFAVADYFNVRVSRGTLPGTGLVWMLGVGVVPALAIAFATGLPGPGERTGLAWAALAGVLDVAGLGALYAGLRRGTLSIVAPLTALNGAVAAVISIAAGEAVGAITAVGIVLAVLGTVLAASEGSAGTAAGAGWALLSALVFGVILILFAAAGDTPAVWVLAASRVASFVVMAPVAWRLGGFVLERPARRPAVSAGAFDALGVLALSAAVARGPVSVASVMVAQFATMAVLIGVFVFGERPRRHQLAGIGCTIVAVTVLAATGVGGG